jgi:hypothetical protein
MNVLSLTIILSDTQFSQICFIRTLLGHYESIPVVLNISLLFFTHNLGLLCAFLIPELISFSKDLCLFFVRNLNMKCVDIGEL